MVKFAKELARTRHDAWSEYYLNYKQLKKHLKRSLDSDSISTVLALDNTDITEFQHFLEQEIEKVALFFLKTQGELADELLQLQEVRLAAISSSNPNSIDSCITSYREIGERVCTLVEYICLNVTAVRKILKKHDKNAAEESALTRRFWEMEVNRTDYSHLPQLYRYDGIVAIVATVRGGLGELTREAAGVGNGGYGAVNGLGAEPIVVDYEALLERDPTILKIEKARRQLNQKSEFTKTMAMSSGLFLEDDSSTSASESTPKNRDKMSSLLNLLSTFLYMTNYYIVAPTSGKYAVALGGDASLAGLLIGATPTATLFSTVLYSWWANRSYKSALIFASACSLLGNILYSMALPCGSLWMAMAGRILNGFGGARAINRRYIADATPREERTAASAEFVTAGALGMSAGPALASIFGWTIRDGVGNYWTQMTAPGWIMGLAWTVYIFAAYYYFKEPVRPEAPKVAEMTSLLPTNGVPLAVPQLIPVTVKEKSLWSNVPVMTTLGLYFVLKLVLESLFSSCPSVTHYYFDWTPTESGAYLAILGVLIFPANLYLAKLSYRYDDRDIIWFITLVMLFGLVGMLAYPILPYTIMQYIVFGVAVFIATNVLEGACMSLLSKTIPASYARGTFNSGFLATESGTAGRAVGDMFISYVGSVWGMDWILNGTFGVLLGVTAVSVGLLKSAYPNLVEKKNKKKDEDEDDE
eukprot:CAMPEP_0194405396 /NCGR_PEP_ID=MMETSP0176-20130528/3771_1 /TAXON_ID=216777 /ORGANISM="Proboscia alata, Strain PI-D3" /LENGTH=700 /DNA_ID=CAMNT_0039204161 /DNA_START=181 /DNA_END=2283 /DNA_ORIENTATION=-